jgi:hypothetical protein
LARIQALDAVVTLLARAMLAFLICPGTVAFFVPLFLFASGGRGSFIDRLGLIPLVAGLGLLVWCVREFYVAGVECCSPAALRLGFGISIVDVGAVRCRGFDRVPSARRALRRTVAHPDARREVDALQSPCPSLGVVQEFSVLLGRQNISRQRHLIRLGLLAGVGFGIWNLLNSLLTPLAENTIPALLVFYGPMFTIWGTTGFAASRRTGRIIDGIKAAAIVALVTFVVFDLMVILRVNLFLYSLTERSDWQTLMRRFQASGSESLRTFIDYNYVTQAPFKILVATTIGAATGVIGGIMGHLSRRAGWTGAG